MKWYNKKFRRWAASEEILDFLNKLHENNIRSENIKIVDIQSTWVNIFYCASKEID